MCVGSVLNEKLSIYNKIVITIDDANSYYFFSFHLDVFDLCAHASGDEILALNNEPLQSMSHLETISMFKNIKEGPIVLNIARRR